MFLLSLDVYYDASLFSVVLSPHRQAISPASVQAMPRDNSIITLILMFDIISCNSFADTNRIALR